MVVFSESLANHPPSASLRDLEAGTQAAQLQGCRIFQIPADFATSAGAANALAYLPVSDPPETGVWLGFIPSPERYAELYTAALAHGVHLINSPEEHLRAQEFDRMYPRLEGLTPTSMVLTDLADCAAAADHIGFPMFLKGTVQSRKARGLKACLATNPEELRLLTGQLLDLEHRSRGRVIARRYVPLRHTRMAQSFPQGREYRVFLHRDQVIGWGYYWDDPDELAALSAAEERAVLSLAREAGRRMDVPFISIDIGQAETGEWLVIETGDGQFSGLSHVPRLAIWAALSNISVSGSAD